MTALRRAFDWLFRSRVDGRTTIVQWPNPALWTFIAARVVGAATRASGGFGRALDIVALVAVVAWAVDEVVRGVNPWRRLLGASMLVLQVLHALR